MQRKQCQLCERWYNSEVINDSIMGWCPKCTKNIIVSSLLKRVERKRQKSFN